MSMRLGMKLVVAAALFLGGCATGQQPSPSSASAEKVWGDCVVAAVIRMDDGRTDPLSLAHAIAPQCAVAHNEWSEAMIKENGTPQGQDAARERVNSSEIQFIKSAILIHRSKKHGNKP
jgi:hypothetical protein